MLSWNFWIHKMCIPSVLYFPHPFNQGLSSSVGQSTFTFTMLKRLPKLPVIFHNITWSSPVSPFVNPPAIIEDSHNTCNYKMVLNSWHLSQAHLHGYFLAYPWQAICHKLEKHCPDFFQDYPNAIDLFQSCPFVSIHASLSFCCISFCVVQRF